MKSMFYNYEHDINKKEYPRPLLEPETPEELVSYADMQMIYNATGELLGVSGRQHSKLHFYFHFYGDIDGSPIWTKLKNLNFYIINRWNQKVISKIPNLALQENEVCIEISSEENTLNKGIYRLHLDAEVDGETCTLFSEHDGILEII